ncbi:zinc-responsive transcriptional regulator [compost metagenome]
MKYCIGEFSTILGITRDTLRLYEKHDIVKPVKDDNNSYRYFNDLDARNLLMSRWYRSMQISLQDVATLMKDSPVEVIADKIQESRLLLEEEIMKKGMLLQKMEELHQEIRDIESNLYHCKIKEIPGLYRLKQTNKNSLLKVKELQGVVNEWMDLLPFTFYCFRIDNHDVSTNAEGNLDYSWGLTLTENDAHLLGVEINESMEYIPPAKCVTAVIKRSNDRYISWDSLQFMLDYVQENGYSIKGSIIGKIILTEDQYGGKSTFMEVAIAI